VASFDNVLCLTLDTPVANITAGTSVLYENAAAVGTDWGTSSNTYKACEKLFSGTPRVNSVRVYRREAQAAQTKVVTKTGDFVASNVITYTINGITGTVPYNTSSAQTYTDLATAIAALTDFVGSATASGDDLTIVGVAGADLSINLSVAGGISQPSFATATTVAGWNIKDDIAKANQTEDFYWVGETSHAKATIDAMFGSAQSLEKLAFSSSNEGGIITSSTTDLFSISSAKGYDRAFGLYSGTPADYPEFAWVGNVIKLGNGQVSFAFKQLAGITVDNVTPTARTNLNNKKGNYYTRNGGVSITYAGINFAGTPIEMIWDIDYMRARLTEGVYSLFVANPKVDYNATGYKMIGDRLQLIVNQMVNERILMAVDADGVAPSVFVPNLADVPLNDRQAYIFSGFQITGSYLAAGKKVQLNVVIKL
jgi:hypothetical protein